MDKLDKALDDFMPGKKVRSGNRDGADRRNVRSAPYQRSRPAPRARRDDSEGSWDHDMAEGFSQRRSEGKRGFPGDSSNTIIIKNIHYEITETQLKTLLENSGFPASCMLRLPKLRWDTAGRSTGVATVAFEDARDATEAKRKLDGKTAMEQELTVEYGGFTRQPRSDLLSDPPSLLNRISGPPKSGSLQDRISSRRSMSPPGNAPSGPSGWQNSNRRDSRPQGRDRKTTSRPARNPRPKPKTADDLDSELASFMGTPATAAADKADAREPAEVEMS